MYLTKLYLNQSRKFAYFHTAVYVRKDNDTNFVVENGGFEDRDRNGTITVRPLKEAFSTDSLFFIATPPKDVDDDKTLRYMVQQRALASVGVRYTYDIKAVSCETFSLMMLGMFESTRSAVQEEILRSHKKNLSTKEEERIDERNKQKYEKFHQSVLQNIKSVNHGVVLTLNFLLKNCLHNSGIIPRYGGHQMPKDTEFIDKMNDAYEDLMNAILDNNLHEVKRLMDIGLATKSITAYGKTSLTHSLLLALTTIFSIIESTNVSQTISRFKPRVLVKYSKAPSQPSLLVFKSNT